MRRFVFLCFVSVLLAISAICGAVDRPNGYAGTDGGSWLQTTIPVGVASSVVTCTDLGNGTTLVNVSYAEPTAIGTDSLLFTAYFVDSETGEMTTGVVATGNGAAYHSSPAIYANTAGLVRLTDFACTAYCAFARGDTGFSVTVPSSALAGKSLAYASIRYLPASIPISSTLGGINAVEEHELFSAFEGPGAYVLPSLPSGNVAGGAPVPFGLDSASALVVGDPTPTPIPILPVGPAPRPLPRNLTPPQWGFPWPGTWQPAPPGLVTTDLNGDGTTDYVIPGRQLVPGTTDTYYQGVVCNSSTIVFVIYRDTNGNGKPDRNEVISVLSECVFTSAMNTAMGVYKDSQNRRWIGYQNKNRSRTQWDRGVPPGGSIYYWYNVDTGNIVVYIVDANGRYMKIDSNGNAYYPSDPNWRGPAYMGPPSGYPGWIHGDEILPA